MVSWNPLVYTSRLRCPRLTHKGAYRFGRPSSMCSLSHDGISCAVGQCSRPLVYASRWPPAVSCASHRLAETDPVLGWYSFKGISPARSGIPDYLIRALGSGPRMHIRRFGFSVAAARLSGGLGCQYSCLGALRVALTTVLVVSLEHNRDNCRA